MKTPGIGTRNKRFKNLVGRGRKRNAGKSSKPTIKKDTKVPRKLRSRRIKKRRNKNIP